MKIYYDDGQKFIGSTLHKVVNYALFKNDVTYRSASVFDYRLSQTVDYICAAKLTALEHQDKATTAIDEKFFGS